MTEIDDVLVRTVFPIRGTWSVAPNAGPGPAAPVAFSDQPRVAAAFAAGGCAILCGRNSGESGPKARRLAVDALLAGAEGLAKCGLDVRDALPTREQMLQDLRDAKPVRSVTEDGVKFSNRFVEYDLRATHLVYVVLSTGSAKKLDEALTQPFVERVAAVARDVRPVLVYAHRIDRLCRVAWALAPLVLALRGGWLGDNRRGLVQASGPESVLIFFDAWASEEEAAKLPVKALDGMQGGTGDRFVDGQVPIGFPHSPPPGLGEATLLRRGMEGKPVVYFDDERWRPLPADVAYGLSAIEVDGLVVSQVSNVRWALRHLGRPGWGYLQVAEGLKQRGFSTVGLRRAHHADVPFTHQRADVVLQALREHLEFYRTGVWRIRMGDREVEITDGFPPDGPWCTEEDYERIRSYVDAGGHRFDGVIRLVLAGLPCRVNGVDCRLRTADRRPRTNPPSHYRICRVQGRSVAHAAELPLLDAKQLNDVIIASVVDAGDRALAIMPGGPVDDPEVLELRRELKTRQSELEHLEARAASDLARARRSEVTGALLAALNAGYQHLHDVEIPAADAAVEAALLAVQRAELSAVDRRPGVRVDALLELVAALRDPEDTKWSRFLRHALRDMTFTIDATATGARIAVQGFLSTSFGGSECRVPVSGEWGESSEGDLDVAIDELLANLRGGVPYCDQVMHRRHDLVDELPAFLGVNRAALVFLNCTDARILRVGMESTVFRGGRSDADIADATGEPVALVERVAAVWGGPRGSAHWLHTTRTSLAAVMHVAAACTSDGFVVDAALAGFGLSPHQLTYALGPLDEWERVKGRGWRLRPCACGSVALAPTRLHEISGWVCLSCRRDRSSVHWPSDPYDRYLQNGDLWVAHGFVEPCEWAVTHPARRPPRRAHCDADRGARDL